MAADLLAAALVQLRRDRVMGTWLHVLLHADPQVAPGAGRAATDRLAALEARWSRFLPGSDITVLNGAGGRPVAVHPDTLLLLDRCRLAARRSWGLFDAAVLPAVLAAGYTESYDRLDQARIAPRTPVPTSGLAGLQVDGRHVLLPPGVQVDPGGLGKGLAADLAAQAALDAGADGVLVNLGGDLRAAGRAPAGGWRVQVEDPLRPPAVLATLSLAGGAVATSSRTRRTLGPGHHLIDPRTGAPAHTGLAQVTAIAGEAWWAEALATAAFVGGTEVGADLIGRHAAAALLVTDAGEPVEVGELGRFRC